MAVRICQPEPRLKDLQLRPLVKNGCFCNPCYHKTYKPPYELWQPDLIKDQKRHFEGVLKSTVFDPPEMPSKEIARPEFSLEIYKKKRPFYLCGHRGEMYWLETPCMLKKAMDYTHVCRCAK